MIIRPGLWVVSLSLFPLLASAAPAVADANKKLDTARTKTSTTIIDVYRRFLVRNAHDHHHVRASKVVTVFWGLFSIGVGEFATHLGSLVEAVNRFGSLFYGTILAVFILAFFFNEVGGTAAEQLRAAHRQQGADGAHLPAVSSRSDRRADRTRSISRRSFALVLEA